MNYPIFNPKEGDNYVRILASEKGTVTLIDRADAQIKTWTPAENMAPFLEQCITAYKKFWGDPHEYDISIFINKKYNSPEWMLAPYFKKRLTSEETKLIALSGDPSLNHLKANRFKKDSQALLHCSFCHKTHKDVQVLVATDDDIGICESCVKISYDLAAKKLKQPTIKEFEAKLEKALAPREKSYFEKLANR